MRRYYNGEKNRERLYKTLNESKYAILGDNEKKCPNGRSWILDNDATSQLKTLIRNGLYKTPTKYYYDVIVNLVTDELTEWRIKI